MVDALLLTFGLILGLLFVVMMCTTILPQADQVVKKQYGPVEAYCTTRFCCICIALPFYVFTIWMILVNTFEFNAGIAMIDQICPDDFSCTSSFAFGREHRDPSACTNPDCGDDRLQARAGVQPLNFARLGLGESVESSRDELSYECVEASENLTDPFCAVAKSKEDGALCNCLERDEDKNLCTRYDCPVNDDLTAFTQSTSCLDVTATTVCREWLVTSDSQKQFTFQTCTCSSFSLTICEEWTCDTLTTPYFYPNVFFAGCVTILFIFPLFAVFYYTIKTQMKKICPCGEYQVYVYSQEAGMQHETTAENVATGGYTEEQVNKTKYRRFAKKDMAVVLFVPLIEAYLIWLVLESSGRVGLSFVGLSAGVIVAVELYKYVQFIMKRNENKEERVERNNPGDAVF